MEATNISSDQEEREDDASRMLVGDLESLGTEISRQRELYLRLAADFDNYRKRTAQESERRASSKKEALIHELLPVIDNLERALVSNPSREQLHEGVQMTLQQIKQLLRRHAIDPEGSTGNPFDPRYHEALAVRHDPSKPDQLVLETVQRGYRRGDVVFRPAKVVVNDLSHGEISHGHRV